MKYWDFLSLFEYYISFWQIMHRSLRRSPLRGKSGCTEIFPYHLSTLVFLLFCQFTGETWYHLCRFDKGTISLIYLTIQSTFDSLIFYPQLFWRTSNVDWYAYCVEWYCFYACSNVHWYVFCRSSNTHNLYSTQYIQLTHRSYRMNNLPQPYDS